MIPPHARVWIQEALNAIDRPLYTVEAVETELAANNAMLWLGERSCVVTTLTDFPSVGERVIEVWLAGGDLEEIKDMIPQIEAWAVQAGCTQAEVNGRLGWVRTLAPFGFEYLTTTVRKFLGHGQEKEHI